MFAKKHGPHKGLIRGIVLLLSLVTLLTSLNLGGIAVEAESVDAPVIRYGDTAVDSIVLPQDDKRTLSTDEIADASYRWQLCADSEQELWVNIHRQRQSFITLSYAMVGSLLDRNGTVLLRCVVTENGESRISAPVRVQVSYSVKELSQPQTAAPVLRAPRRAAPSEDELKSYTVTVSFIYEDGRTAFEPYTANIAAGSAFTYTVRFPEAPGYLPYFEDAAESTSSYTVSIDAIGENVTYTVTYKPTLVPYTVHHYVQNVQDDNYTLLKDTTREGLTATPIGNDCAEELEGFTALRYDTDEQIAADGSTEVNVYYDRNYYLLSFDLNGGYGVEPIYARYEAVLSVNKPTRPGYVFDGWELKQYATEDGKWEWQDAGSDLMKKYELQNSITLPAMNLKYQAKWTTTDTKYTVVYWAENADDDGYSYLGSKKVDAVSASKVSGKDDCPWTDKETEKQYFTYDAEKTEKDKIVLGDGSTVVNVYYTRNRYTLTFKNVQQTLTCTKTEHEHSDACCKHGGTSLTHWFHRDNCCKLGLSEHTHGSGCYTYSDLTFTAKYGADIHDRFPIKDGDKTIWWEVPKGTKTYGDSDETRYLGSIDTMPGENITFSKKDSESGAVIYYYVETIGGASGDTSYNGKNYKLYKKIDLDYSSSVSLTYREEFHPIKGFTQGDSKPKLPKDGSVKMEQSNYLYYTRDSYTLKFYNYNAWVKEEAVQYEAPLLDKNFTPEYPAEMEPNAYEFAGWYTTAGCYPGSEVDWSKATMPADDLSLYAKWEPKTHTVRVYKTADKDDLLSTQEVSHGDTANAPEDFENGSYVFNGWFYMENGEKKAFDFNNMPVNRDLDIFAEWSSKVLVQYTVRYELEDGTKIAEPTVGTKLAGTSKTFTAKCEDELDPAYRVGYFPKTNSHTILMKLDESNEFIFVYVAKPDAPYTVRYLEKGTNNVLKEEKKVPDNRFAVVTEKFEQISGYMPDAYQKRLVLSANETENVLTFWYTKDELHAYYAVIHWVQNLEGEGYTEYRTIQSPGKIGETIEEEPLTLTGFAYNAEKSNASGELTADGLVLNLYYDRIEYPYTVKYLEYGTNNVLAPEKTSTEKYRYGKVVSETAIEIAGYSLVGDATKVRTIRESGNEIVFYYNEQEVTIKYVAVPAEGGTVSHGSETIKARTGKAQGSTPTPQPGYRFAGWYTDEACTNRVDSTWVDASQTITPQKNGDIYQPATYYASFVKNNTDLTITKTGAQEIDEYQTFLFRIKGTDGNTEGIDLTVTVCGNGSVKITELPVGEYTVTELTDWSWRYQPEKAEVQITLDAAGGNVLKFINSRTQQYWLGGDGYSRNNFEN